MKNGRDVVYYIAIFKWSELPNSIHNTSTDSRVYHDLHDLEMQESDSVGYFEVKGYIPTKEEFSMLMKSKGE